MSQIKDIFIKMAGGPAGVESSLTQIPKISGIMVSIAQSLPPSPELPVGIPSLPIPGAMTSALASKPFPQVVRGTEDSFSRPTEPLRGRTSTEVEALAIPTSISAIAGRGTL